MSTDLERAVQSEHFQFISMGVEFHAGAVDFGIDSRPSVKKVGKCSTLCNYQAKSAGGRQSCEVQVVTSALSF